MASVFKEWPGAPMRKAQHSQHSKPFIFISATVDVAKQDSHCLCMKVSEYKLVIFTQQV